AFPIIAEAFRAMPLSQAKFNLVAPITQMLAKTQSTEYVKQGVDLVVELRNSIPEQYGITPVINNFLKNIIKEKETSLSTAQNKNDLQEQINYINSKIEEEKKGF